MATQREIVDAIKTSVRPYAIATHGRISKELCVRIDRVTRNAMEFAEEIDSFQKGTKPTETTEAAQDFQENVLLHQLRSIVLDAEFERNYDKNQQFVSESENMQKARDTVDLVTDELLERVGCELPNNS